MPAARFWQQIGEQLVTALCQLPAPESRIEVEPPAPADCARWILAAPPMRGGEYLSEESLRGVWTKRDRVGARRRPPRPAGSRRSCGRGPRAGTRWGGSASTWPRTRNDEDRPFAFLATYAAGFGASGRVKHLPLRRALAQYAGAKNRAALVKLLTPIQQAAETCDWVRELVGRRRRLPAAGVDAGARLSAAARAYRRSRPPV